MTKEELSQLITDYGNYLYSFCCNLTGNSIEADDLYQDTLLKAVELCHKLDSSGNPKSFLMGISVKLWQNHRKKYAVRHNIIQMEELTDNLMLNTADTQNQPEVELIKKEIMYEIRMEIKRLPVKIQIVLYMYYTAQVSIEDISKAIHIPKGTVKSRLHRGRKLMKEYLEVKGYGI